MNLRTKIESDGDIYGLIKNDLNISMKTSAWWCDPKQMQYVFFEVTVAFDMLIWYTCLTTDEF